MKLFDGSAEYVAASDISVGDTVKCSDNVWRKIVSVERDKFLASDFVAEDGFRWSSPMMQRELRKLGRQP